MRFLKKNQLITSSLNNRKETSKENLKRPKVCKPVLNQDLSNKVKERQLLGVPMCVNIGAHCLSPSALRSSDVRPR